MKPLPADADLNDPRWAAEFTAVMNGLVQHRTRCAIMIDYFRPHLKKGRVKALYKTLLNSNPASGAVLNGEARHFAITSPHRSAGYVLQGAIFLECFDRLRRIAGYRLHRGWLLLHAYNAYVAQTQRIMDTIRHSKRLEINQCYALLRKVGHLDGGPATAMSELQRRTCGRCGTTHLIVTSEELDIQPCPVCLIHRNNTKGAVGESIRRSQRDAAGKPAGNARAA